MGHDDSVNNVRQLRPSRRQWGVTGHAALSDVRFVGPDEFVDGSPATVMHSSLVRSVVCDALVAAADDEGLLPDFDEKTFFDSHVTDVMRRESLEHDEEAPTLVYDRFTAFALMDCLRSLARDGLIATRVNDDASIDYRLTLP